jgi:hypothetical protein
MIRSLGLGRLSRVFDLDDLPATVRAAVGADVVRPLHAAAVLARHELNGGNEVMAAAIALTRAADTLFWKCTHDL